LSAPINTTAGFAITGSPIHDNHLSPNIRRAAVQKNGGTGAKMWNLFAKAKNTREIKQADA
jgi:hypothetical protein